MRTLLPTDTIAMAASHEAGHAVIKCCISETLTVGTPELRIDQIEVHPNGYGITHMSAFDGAGNDPFSAPSGFEFILRTRRGRIERDIVVALAGAVAEATIRSVPPHSLFQTNMAGAGDWNFAMSRALHMGLSTNDASALCTQLRETAEGLIRHPNVGRAIRAVARVLQEPERQGQITGNTAISVIQRAWEMPESD